jgi:hypothetical protein
MSGPREVGLTLIGGMIGGFLTTVPALGEPAIWTDFGLASWFKFVLGPVLLGAAASGIGVFVLTTTDTTLKARMFFFAIICGLAFPSILTSAKESVGSMRSQVLVQITEEKAQSLRQLVSDESAAPVQVAKAASEILDLAKRSDSPRAVEAATNAVGVSIQNLSAQKTEESAKELASIGVTAARTQSYDAAINVLKEFNRQIAANTGDEKNWSAEGKRSVVAALPPEIGRDAERSHSDSTASGELELRNTPQ